MQYSIIVPHYNDAERLCRLLKSIPHERKDLEVIVIDDCSSDQASIAKVRKLWPDVCWLHTSDNAGAGVARNIGLDAASGEWLVFADSDDEFMPDAFDNFDNTLRKEDEVVYFLAEGVNEIDGTPSLSVESMNYLVSNYHKIPTDSVCKQLQLKHVVPWAKIYSSTFIKSIGVKFDPVKFGNDIAFNVLAAIQAKRIRAAPFLVYRYYKRSGSLTADLNVDAFLLRFQQSRSLAKRLAELGLEKVRPATGYMLRSLKYGPRVAFYVWCQAFQSPMKIEWLRLFQPNRWVRRWFSERAVALENTRMSKSTRAFRSKK